MRFRQLRYFEAVAEELHFGKAAERLHIQQPPLSRQIQSLEEEVGVQLLKRTNRKVELTEEGKYYLSEVKKILRTANRAQATLDAMGEGTAGKLQVGFVYLVLSSHFPDTVGQFMKEYPMVEVAMHDESSKEQAEAVREGSRHVGFIVLNDTDITGLEHIVVQEVPPCAAIPADHPLAAQKEVTIADLTTLPFICSLEPTCKQRKKNVISWFHEEGHEVNFGMQYRRKHTGNVFVAAGFGWTIVNCGSEHIIPQGIAIRPIKANMPPFRVGMIWNPERATQLVKNFVHFFKNSME
ncbi:MAG: LysR family transcriptional regulator [Desulfovibrio sp.]